MRSTSNRNSQNQSRSIARNKSPLLNVGGVSSANIIANNNLNTSFNSSKRGTKFPLISNSHDDFNAQTINPAQNSGLIVGVCSQQGKRPYQEDEYCIRPYLSPNPAGFDQENEIETHFFGLFDGHAGGRCSKHVATCLANTLTEDAHFFTNLPQALRRAFHTTNEQFLKIAEKMKLHDGSTGICVVFRENKVLVANVGDCRALIISGGRAIALSNDQKPTNPEEVKRIQALGGTVEYCMGVARVNRVLAVSRAFGNRTLRNVIRPDAELTQRDVCRDDEYLVMASDGLWDVMKNKDVADICSSAMHMQMGQINPQAIAEELVQTALARGSMDNVTCLVVKLTNFVQRTLATRDLAALNDREMMSSQQRIEKVLHSQATNHNSNANHNGMSSSLINHQQQQQQQADSSNLAARPSTSDYSPQTSKYFATMESKMNDDYMMNASSKKPLHQQMVNNSGMNGNGNGTSNFGANGNNAGSAGGPRIPGINIAGGRVQSPKARIATNSLFNPPPAGSENLASAGGMHSSLGSSSSSSHGSLLTVMQNSLPQQQQQQQQQQPPFNALFKTASFKRHDMSSSQEDVGVGAGSKGEWGGAGPGINNITMPLFGGPIYASLPKSESTGLPHGNKASSFYNSDLSSNFFNDGALPVASSPTFGQPSLGAYGNRPATSGGINMKSSSEYNNSLPSAAINHLASTLHNPSSLFKSPQQQASHASHGYLASTDYKQGGHSATAPQSKGYGWVDRVK